MPGENKSRKPQELNIPLANFGKRRRNDVVSHCGFMATSAHFSRQSGEPFSKASSHALVIRLFVFLFSTCLLSFIPSAHAAGVTVITHGYQGDTNWLGHMADAIAQRMGGTDKVAQYTLRIVNAGVHQARIGSFTQDNGAPALSGVSSCEAIVKVDWTDVDGGVCPEITPTTSIAPLIASTLIWSNVVGGNSLGQLPIHLIGHSRGSSVMAEVARILGTNGIWVDQLTTLDPYPFICNIGKSDAAVNIYTNVIFADNFYQTNALIANGTDISGAYNRLLTNTFGGYEGIDASHSDVHLWYHGTIDLNTPTSDGDTNITADMRTSWWTASENQGANTGFYFDRFNGGTMDGGTRPNEGLRLSGASRQALAVTATGANAWDNIEIINFATDQAVVQGNVWGVNAYFEDANHDATVEIGLDTDGNPYNGGMQVLSSQSTSFIASNFLQPVFNANATPTGTYCVYAKISNGTHTRYYYAQGTLTIISATGLVAYYPFNGNANDASGNGNNGAVNAALTSDLYGNPNKAYSFNGSDSQIIVPDASTLNPTVAISIVGWFKANQWDGNPRMIEKGGEYMLIGSTYNGNILWFSLGGVTPDLRAPLPSTGTWHHIAATYNGTTMKLYLDGSPYASQPVVGAISVTSAPLVIGNKPGSPYYYDHFDGLVDEVRIYDRALSDSEIQQLAYWPLQITTQPHSQTVNLGTSATFSVGVSGQSPLTYQWYRNGISLAGRTDSTLIIDSPQSGNAGNYTVVITNNGGAITSSVAVLTVVTPQNNVIAQWNFNSLTSDANSATGTTSPSIGSGVASLVGQATATFATGDLSLDAVATAANDNSGWNIDSFPFQGINNKTAGVQFKVSTAGKQNIIVSWSERHSNTASKYVRLQYTINGTVFLDYPIANYVSVATNFEAKARNLAGLPGVDNNTNFAFRIVSEFESTANGTGGDNYLASNLGSGYTTNGTIRFDMVTVSGVAIPVSAAVLSSPAFTGNHFQFLLTGSAGANYVIQSSTNLNAGGWVSVFTNVSPFTFVETNTSAFQQKFYRAVPLP